MDKYKGKDVRVFQNVTFYGGEFPSIEIELVNPENGKDVDHYEYKNGSWSIPKPVQISGNGDMKDNTTPLNDIKFANVAVMYKNWQEKAKSVEGALRTEPKYISFNLSVVSQLRYWTADDIETARQKYTIKFNTDGSVSEFKAK